MLAASIISLLFIGSEIAPSRAIDTPLPFALSGSVVQMESSRDNRYHFTAAQCRGIADLSTSSRPVFTEKEDGEWECNYLLEYSETGHKPSMFIQIRGMEPEIWSSFRLKLNFGSRLSRQMLGTRAANLVAALAGTDAGTKLDVALATEREFDMTFDDLTLRYRQERIDKNRFNLFGSRNIPPETMDAPSSDRPHPVP